MRATMTGLTMTLINVVALAFGTVVAGAVIDRLAESGSSHALTTVLLATDGISLCSGVLFWLAARQLRLGRASVNLNVSSVPAH